MQLKFFGELRKPCKGYVAFLSSFSQMNVSCPELTRPELTS